VPPANSEIWLVVGESYARGAATDRINPSGFPNGPLWEVTATPLFAKLAEPTAINSGGTTSPSPGAVFVWRRYQTTGKPQILVNAGRGGTRTDEWLPASSAWYDLAVSSANWAIANSRASLAGIIGMWGVNNAIDVLGDFPNDVDDIIAGLRAEVTGAASVPFVFTRIQPWAVAMGAWAVEANWDAVRAAQAAYTNTDTYMADIPTGTMTSDGLHPQSVLNAAIAENILGALP
jgi:hypothetical protein